ncbi:SusC/RagA family TonB-linked outer membrane protein [Christiangramia fulva]|uniref:SusC/RagA family TonB-linked outer membrane protein n=1 Tax=Christiangramia fulva TaxID=2126553 RepID=A0A2R3ZA20_9FLAO|nr:TonB-dependent receptor [Christiangramia fulva]AVR47116.1 SusC/RagA family TonB-linked outer membrane protein [Christiangramia fulva]
MSRKTIFLFLSLLSSSLIWSQEREVTGIVTEADSGLPLPGVTVVVDGTSNGVVTDFDGKYSIQASSDATLVFSFIGYETVSKAVNGSSEINVALQVATASLDEVVLVGYSTQKKSNVTASVSEIDGEKLSDATAPDVSTLLQGKAAGVQVVQASGRPGSSSSIRIRGIASTGGNASPLWVVDGVIQHGVPNLNPNDIESISVLKDASATALYGSRGANGVVQVVTKSGKNGVEKLSISSRSGLSYFNNGNFEIMNSQQLYDYYQSFGNPESIPEGIDEQVLTNDFDWFGNGTQTGIVQDHNLSFTGGNEKSSTFISLGYFKETGTLKDVTYDRVSFRLNHEYEVIKNLTLKPKIGITYEKDNSREHSLYSLYTYLPWDKPYNDEGELINPQVDNVTWYGRDQSNYLYDLQYNYGKSRTLNLLTNFDIEYKILPYLTFISTNSVTLFYSDSMYYTDPNSNGGRANLGAVSNDNAKRYTNFTNQMLRFSKTFGDHNINALAAYEYNNYKYQSSGGTGYGIVPGSEILNNTTTPADVRGGANDYALQSFLFNTEYSYDTRYLVQFSLRRDGASNFGLENQYGTFFSGSLGWNIHNEDFFNIETINLLKLRASYGGLGNRPGSLYPQYELHSLGYNYNGIPAVAPSQLGNEDLKWEKSYQTNFGLDFRGWDRFNLSLDYYIKDTSGLLYFVSLPATSGYTGYWENIGGIKNTGFEVNFNYDIFTSRDGGFNWSVRGNIGFNDNEITSVYEGEPIDRGTKITKVGEDFNSWYMPKWLGVDPETGNPLWETIDEETGERSETTNYNEADKQIVGTSSPDFYGGFATDFRYSGFTLSANFNFSKGGKIYNASRELYDSDGAYPTYNQMVLADGWSRWEAPGDIATHPKPYYGGNNLSNKTSSRYLEDGSYLRLRNIRLGYSFEQNLIQRIGLSNAEIYITADNLMTITDYTGTDPEVGIDGFASTTYPVSKRVALGINLSL